MLDHDRPSDVGSGGAGGTGPAGSGGAATGGSGGTLVGAGGGFTGSGGGVDDACPVYFMGNDAAFSS